MPTHAAPASQDEGPAPTPATPGPSVEHDVFDDLWSKIPDSDKSAIQEWIRATEELPAAERQRQLKELLEDLDLRDSLACFEKDETNLQNCLGRPGEVEALLKKLLKPAGPPCADRPALYPSYGVMCLMQQRVGEPQAIMDLIIDGIKAGTRVMEFIQTPCLSETFLIDLMYRLKDEFKEKKLRLFLGASIVQAQRVAALLLACMREAEDLGGRIFPFFLSEHDERATDHEKLEWSIDIISGRATISVMTANAGSRGFGQEAAHASDPEGAPKSFEIIFQGTFDARDDKSHFWRHLAVITDGLIVRRALGALIMPTEALFEMWLRRGDPLELFDEKEYRRTYSAEHAARVADAQNRKSETTQKKRASEALRLRRERQAFASAASADQQVKDAAAKPAAPPPAAAKQPLTEDQRLSAKEMAGQLQARLDIVLSEHPESRAAYQKVQQRKRQIRNEVKHALPLEKVARSRKTGGTKVFKSQIPRVQTTYRHKVIDRILAERDEDEHVIEPNSDWIDEPAAEVPEPASGGTGADKGSQPVDSLTNAIRNERLDKRSTNTSAAQSIPQPIPQPVSQPVVQQFEQPARKKTFENPAEAHTVVEPQAPMHGESPNVADKHLVNATIEQSAMSESAAQHVDVSVDSSVDGFSLGARESRPSEPVIESAVEKPVMDSVKQPVELPVGPPFVAPVDLATGAVDKHIPVGRSYPAAGSPASSKASIFSLRSFKKKATAGSEGTRSLPTDAPVSRKRQHEALDGDPNGAQTRKETSTINSPVSTSDRAEAAPSKKVKTAASAASKTRVNAQSSRQSKGGDASIDASLPSLDLKESSTSALSGAVAGPSSAADGLRTRSAPKRGFAKKISYRETSDENSGDEGSGNGVSDASIRDAHEISDEDSTYELEDDEEVEAGPSSSSTPKPASDRGGLRQYNFFTPKQDDFLVARAAKGWTWDEIAAAMEGNHLGPAISARAARLKTGVQRRRWTAEDDQQLRQWVDGGESYKEIARRLARSEGACRERIRTKKA
ncbi:uncharacterized protein JCM10292_007441 [Rhodotorula paludigena]|uniref:uncharacterized protein n=1 Tax=Rhodotorula paludigena TaxID=86838 RepID=UPI00318002CF